MKLINIYLILLLGISCSNPVVKKTSRNLDQVYHQAQREFAKKNFESSLTLLEEYITKSKNSKIKEERLFWAIDQVGRIYLRVKRDPNSAIIFFQKALRDPRLKDGQVDDIESWITASKDWIKLGKMRTPNINKEELFKNGKMFFDKGLKQKVSQAKSNKGRANFAIAKYYLIPLTIRFDKSKYIGEALLMLGQIQIELRTDMEYWSDNYYLKEAIRRFPHTKLAMRSWNLLKDDIKIGYTGSAGDNTPQSMFEMLQRYKKLASINKK